MSCQETSTPTRSPWNRDLARLGLSLAIPVVFALVILLFFPFRYPFEFDPDEGVNAMKAFLVLRGHRLYFDIWSDQPPVFTFLLAGWFRILGEKTLSGRLLVLAFSAGLMTVASAFLRRTWGLLAAIVALALLLLVPYYAQLSVSIMIGLPSIALALGSFYALDRWHRESHPLLLVLSALLLGSSILTKLFTAVLIPVWLAGLILQQTRLQDSSLAPWTRWYPVLVWAGTLGAFGLLALFGPIGPGNLGQLLDVHLVSSSGGVPVWSSIPGIRYFLAPALPILLLAILGAWRGVRARTRTVLYLAGWVALGGIFLWLNRPAWYHHQLLVTVPAAILAAIAISAAIRDFAQWKRSRPGPTMMVASLLTAALLLVFVIDRAPAAADTYRLDLPNLHPPPPASSEEGQILALMWNHIDDTEWVYTDRPMFAFSIRRPVPPKLAVLTEKRLVAGGLSDAEVLQSLEAYSPTLILEGQFSLPAIQRYMEPRNYARLDSTLRYRLYLRPPDL